MEFTFLLTIIILSFTELAFGLFSFLPLRIKRNRNFYPNISIIIPVKNETEIIEKVIKSWLNLKYPGNKEIIVIDQSEDGSYEKIKEISESVSKVKVLHILPEKSNKFTAELRGIKMAEYEYIVICDADKIPSRKSLDIVNYLSEEEKIGAVFQNTIPREEKNILQIFSGFELMNKYVDQEGASAVDSVPYLSLSSAIIRKDLLTNIEPDLNLFSDDILFAIKIKEKNFRAVLISENPSSEGVVSSIRDLVKKRLRVSYGTYQAAVNNYWSSVFNSKYGRLGFIILPLRQLNYILGAILMPFFIVSLFFLFFGGRFSLLILGYILILIPFIFRTISIFLSLNYRNPRYLLIVLFYPLYYLFLYKFFASLSFFRAFFGFSVKWKKTISDRNI